MNKRELIAGVMATAMASIAPLTMASTKDITEDDLKDIIDRVIDKFPFIFSGSRSEENGDVVMVLEINATGLHEAIVREIYAVYGLDLSRC